VAARFVGDPEICAGTAPFFAVRGDPPAAGPGLAKQMGQFVAEGALDLCLAKGAKPAVEQNALRFVLGAARSGAKPSRPLHTEPARERFRGVFAEEPARQGFQFAVATWSLFHDPENEREFELPSAISLGSRKRVPSEG
jgi:hypothetical protein